MSAYVDGNNLVIPYSNTNPNDTVVIPFPDTNSANYVGANFAGPIETYAPGIQVSQYITDPSQIALGLANPSAPTALFVQFSDTSQSTLDLTNQNAYAVVNASTVPITLNDSDNALQSIISGVGGMTLYAAGANGAAAFAGGENIVTGGTTGVESWYFDFEGGTNTISAGAGNDTITGSPDTNLMFLGSGNDIVYSEGMDTIVGDTGADTINAVGQALAFNNSASMVFINTNIGSLVGSSTIIGGSGALSVFGGSGEVTVFGGSANNEFMLGGTGNVDALIGGTGSASIFGAGQYNYLASGTTGADTIVSAPSGTSYMFGNPTATDNVFGGEPNAVNATDIVVPVAGVNTIFGGDGSSDTTDVFTAQSSDLIWGGPGVLFVQQGSGTNTVYDSSKFTLFGFVNGQAGGNLDIYDFNPLNAAFTLDGYASGTATNAVSSATVSNGSTTFTLPDNTHVTLEGYTGGLTHASFV